MTQPNRIYVRNTFAIAKLLKWAFFDRVIPSSTAQFNKQTNKQSEFCSSFIIQKFGLDDDNAGESTDKHLVSVPPAI